MVYFLKNKFFRNIFLSYALLMSGLILIFFVTFIYQKNSRQQEKLYQAAENRAKLMGQILDDKLSDVELIATQIIASNWEKYMNANSEILSSRVDYFEKQEICQTINDFNALLGITKSTAVLNTKKDMAVDNRSFWESERYFKSMGLPVDFMDTLIDIVELNYNSLILYREKESNNILTVKRLDYSSSPKVILITIIDEKLFQRFLKISMTDVKNLVLCLNDDIIYSYTGNTENDFGENCYNITVSSAMYQWEYNFDIILDDYEENTYAVWIYIFSFAGTILLSLGLAYCLTRYTYRPIQKVVRKMNIYKKDYLSGLEDIEHIYEDLKNENEMLESIGIQYYEIGKNGFLISLLKGSYDKKRVEERMNQLHICFNVNMSYMVIAITNVPTGGHQDFINEMRKLQSECYHYGVYSQMFHMNDNYIMILGTNADESNLSKVSENIGLLLDEYLDKVDTELFAGKIHKEIIGIHKSWQEVEDKMQKHKNSGNIAIYYYPYEAESRLINAMRVGNFVQAENVLEEIRVKNEERNVLMESVKKVVSLIYEGFTRFAMEGIVNWTGNDIAFAEIMEDNKLPEMWDFLNECINEIEKAYYDEELNKSIGEQIVVYVQENYTNAGISQQLIADEFNISRTSVSKIFKETTGMNFIEYLHKMRIAHAKLLIENGNYDVIDVAAQSGYEKEITFKRAFVKYQGVSPREYVKHKKNM